MLLANKAATRPRLQSASAPRSPSARRGFYMQRPSHDEALTSFVVSVGIVAYGKPWLLACLVNERLHCAHPATGHLVEGLGRC